MRHSATKARAKGALAGFVAASLAASLMIPSLAFAEPTSAEKQAEAQSALASLNAMQDKLEQTAIAYDEAVAAQKEAEANRNEAQARIDEATGQIADLQDHLGTRARSMYRTGNSTLLDLLFGSTTFAAFATNWDLLNTLNQNDADLVQQTKDLRAEVQEQEAVLAEQERIAKEKADEAKRSKDETAGTIASMQATYDSLSAEAAALLEQERAAQQAAEAAKAEDVVNASIQQAAGGNAGNAGNTDGGNTGYTPSPSPAPSYDEAIAGTVVGRAYSQIGKAYGYGDPSYGAGPNEYDCSGFVSFCLLGSYSRMGSTSTFMAWPTVSDPQPGDVCVNSGHCGIYIGNNQMIHAATYGVGVVIGPVQAGMKIVRP
ncbi:coiled-coil domain-containing protein [Gordonibacter pamelaeae]|uniref:coiled-coil domain-containing protein n=1 Tax=Gordonibacter pamelaeae TaxID=471189 RepID=UPI003A915F31